MVEMARLVEIVDEAEILDRDVQQSLVSPRMYYLNRTRQDGKVYIGYIGKHLRNTQTN